MLEAKSSGYWFHNFCCWKIISRETLDWYLCVLEDNTLVYLVSVKTLLMCLTKSDLLSGLHKIPSGIGLDLGKKCQQRYFRLYCKNCLCNYMQSNLQCNKQHHHLSLIDQVLRKHSHRPLIQLKKSHLFQQ